MRSFPVDQVKEALCHRFTDIEVIGGDGRSADWESDGRIWLACARPSSPARSHPRQVSRSGLTRLTMDM